MNNCCTHYWFPKGENSGHLKKSIQAIFSRILVIACKLFFTAHILLAPTSTSAISKTPVHLLVNTEPFDEVDPEEFQIDPDLLRQILFGSSAPDIAVDPDITVRSTIKSGNLSVQGLAGCETVGADNEGNLICGPSRPSPPPPPRQVVDRTPTLQYAPLDLDDRIRDLEQEFLTLKQITLSTSTFQNSLQQNPALAESLSITDAFNPLTTIFPTVQGTAVASRETPAQTAYCTADGQCREDASQAKADLEPIDSVGSLAIQSTTLYRTCALTSQQTLQCWGRTLDGTTTLQGSRTAPFTVPLPSPPLHTVSTLHAQYVLLEDGSVWSWGGNTVGQLGTGTRERSLSPRRIDGLHSIAKIVSSEGISDLSSACALRKDGTVWCWGFNKSGQLGDGTRITRKTPVQVHGIHDAIDLEMSGGTRASACALLQDRTVRCWGSNHYGAIGDGTRADRLVAVEVLNLRNVKEVVSTGDSEGHHRCALLQKGTVQCWGSNRFGQLGNGTRSKSSRPTSVVGLQKIEKLILAGGSKGSTYAITENGTLWSFGYGWQGQLGDGRRVHRKRPVKAMIQPVSDVSVGGTHGKHTACALLQTGNVQCWGNNRYGQVGHSRRRSRYQPWTVTSLKGITDIAVGGYKNRTHACAVSDGGIVRCWGFNGAGQLGSDSTKSHSAHPLLVRAGSTPWEPVGKTLIGALPTDLGKEVSYAVPHFIPSDATEVMLHVKSASQPSKVNGETEYRIFALQDGRQFPQFFYHNSQINVASSNADSIWLPLTPERRIRLSASGNPPPQGMEGYVYAVGYR